MNGVPRVCHCDVCSKAFAMQARRPGRPPKMKKQTINERVYERIQELRRQGKSSGEVAAMLDLPLGDVNNAWT